MDTRGVSVSFRGGGVHSISSEAGARIIEGERPRRCRLNAPVSPKRWESTDRSTARAGRGVEETRVRVLRQGRSIHRACAGSWTDRARRRRSDSSRRAGLGVLATWLAESGSVGRQAPSERARGERSSQSPSHSLLAVCAVSDAADAMDGMDGSAGRIDRPGREARQLQLIDRPIMCGGDAHV